MPRQTQPIEQNTFVGGLITEASPLTFPQNASLDEQNFVLNKNGSRSRRLGLDYEPGYELIDTGQPVPQVGTRLIVNSFKWTNAGGDASKTIIVVQVGSNLDFFDNDIQPLSTGKFYSFDYGIANPSRFSFASVDGNLVITNGGKTVDVFQYDEGTRVITKTSQRLLVRDLFGVEDINGGINLRDGPNLSTRTSTVTGAHIYNLRNQTWAIPHPDFDPDKPIILDTIHLFAQDAVRVSGNIDHAYPSNADSTIPFIYANTDSGVDKIIPRFDGRSCYANPLGNTRAPIGYFIIDALDRGASRVSVNALLEAQYPQNDVYNLGIPVDSTPTGATQVCEFAGRVFYAGFSGDVIGGDSSSPRMSSYVLFSQLVSDISNINACYQVGDPTSKDNADLVDTDGGFIRIQDAYNICGMINLGDILVVFAENGVWSISGGSTSGFSATNYQTRKITSSGCIAASSIVVVENSVVYWSRDGIYQIVQNQYGDYNASNLIKTTIQTYFNSIPQDIANFTAGVYDPYEQQVKWMFYNGPGLADDPTELIINLNLSAWYKLKIAPVDETLGPWVVCGIQTDPFAFNYTDVDVVVGSTEVDVSTDEVIVSARQQISGTKEVIYLIITGGTDGSTVNYTFGTYSNTLHYDWVSFDTVGIDAPSYLLTGYLSAGDFQRNKQLTYLTMHFEQTETYESSTCVSVDNSYSICTQFNLFEIDPSSILVYDPTDFPFDGTLTGTMVAKVYHDTTLLDTVTLTFNIVDQLITDLFSFITLDDTMFTQSSSTGVIEFTSPTNLSFDRGEGNLLRVTTQVTSTTSFPNQLVLTGQVCGNGWTSIQATPS